MCDILPYEYQTEIERLRLVTGQLPAELLWPAAQAVFHRIVGKAMDAAADGFGREASAGNFQPATAQQALVCACVRIVVAEAEAEATADVAFIVTDEYDSHLYEADNDDPRLAWDTLAAGALDTLQSLWQHFYEQVVAPGMPVRIVLCQTVTPWLLAMFDVLALPKRYMHYYGPLADDPTHFHAAIAPAVAALHRQFWRRTGGAPLATAVLVHKTEAAERMSEIFLCDPLTVAVHLTDLERRGCVHWPMCMVQLHEVFSGFFPPVGNFVSEEQLRIRKLCRARAAVVRALGKPYPSMNARLDSAAIVQCMDTVAFALMLLVECLGHGCFPASNPYDMSFLRTAVSSLPTELFRYWKQCLPALLAGDVATYETAMDTKFTAKWSALIRASVRVEGTPARIHFSLRHFLAVTVRKRMPAGAASMKCTDLSWPTWSASTYRLVSNVFPEDASTCVSPCIPLLHLPPSVDKHLAFAPPSPRLLFSKVYAQEASVESKWVDAFAMVWRTAYTARRECEPLAELTCHPPIITRRGKRAKIVMEVVPCYACGTAHAPRRDACSQHPLCLQCYLTFKESRLMDMLRQGAAPAVGLTACAAPDCAHEHSMVELNALLSCEMRTVLHIVRHGRPVMACAYCGHEVASASAESVLRECGLCHMQTCTQCLGLAHPGLVCSIVYLREAGKTPATILSEAKMQSCPGCAVPSVKAEGCNHMTCVCGAHWCWLCGCAVDARDPAAHFTDVAGGDVAARCKMQQYSAASEVARMVAAITRRTDISEELKTHCIDAVTGKLRSGDMVQAAADI